MVARVNEGPSDVGTVESGALRSARILADVLAAGLQADSAVAESGVGRVQVRQSFSTDESSELAPVSMLDRLRGAFDDLPDALAAVVVA
jgi:hypothetical protein